MASDPVAVYQGFPDLAVEVVNLAADGDTVVMHGRAFGTVAVGSLLVRL